MNERFSNNVVNKKEKKFPKLSFIRENSNLAAVVSKITPIGNESDNDRDNRLKNTQPSDNIMSLTSSQISQSIKDADLIFQLLPELVLVKQILVSSILSPKDLVSTEINYTNEDCDLPPEITNALMETVRNHFDNVYKIKRILPKILEDALFDTGSYPLAVIPESSLDAAINSNKRISIESIADEVDNKGHIRSIGILGRNVEEKESVNYSLESFFKTDGKVSPVNHNDFKLKANINGKDVDLGIEVYDNHQYLKIPHLRRRLIEDRIDDIITKRSISTEAFDHQSKQDFKIESSFYNNKRTEYRGSNVYKIENETDRPNIGHPLVMKLPSESCIPVYVPGNPSEHLGYFIILDETGNPLSSATSTDYYQQMGYNLYNNNNQVASQLIGSTAAGTSGVQPELAKQKFNEAFTVYINTVEKDLLTRLKNGVYGEDVEIAKASDVYRIMLSRSLANVRTHLLYIPKSLLTYFAFDYNDDGVGISLTEKSKVIASIRAVLLFANTMASIKNSIGRTAAKITLDPKDRNPVETVEYMLHEFAKHRRSTFPFGTYNPVDLIEYLSNAGIDVAVTGNPGYPETAFDIENKNNNVSKPDTELEESMKKRHIQSYGLAPETVDLSMGVDFATSVVSSNLLLSKRVLMYQEILSGLLEEFITNYTLASGTLMLTMKETIESNKDKLPDSLANISIKRLIKLFLQSLRITLPSPDTITLENQMKAFDGYKDALEKALDAYFSSEFLDSSTIGDDLSGTIEPTKAAIKAYFLRKWLSENNVLPELTDITMLSKEGEDKSFNLLDIMDSHVEGLSNSLKEYMEKIKSRVGNPDSDGYTGDDGSSDTDTDTSSDSGSDESSGSDDSGDMDVDFDFDKEPKEDKEDETKATDKKEETTEESSSSKTSTSSDGTETTTSSSSSSVSSASSATES